MLHFCLATQHKLLLGTPASGHSISSDDPHSPSGVINHKLLPLALPLNGDQWHGHFHWVHVCRAGICFSNSGISTAWKIISDLEENGSRAQMEDQSSSEEGVKSQPETALVCTGGQVLPSLKNLSSVPTYPASLHIRVPTPPWPLLRKGKVHICTLLCR